MTGSKLVYGNLEGRTASVEGRRNKPFLKLIYNHSLKNDGLILVDHETKITFRKSEENGIVSRLLRRLHIRIKRLTKR